MNFYTSSRGISNNPQIATLLSTNRVRGLSLFSRFLIKDKITYVGWGYKPNTAKTRALAIKTSSDYWALEDGFIGWLNHPSQSKPFQRLSYIVDKLGIYYDASAPSGLDQYCEALSAEESERVDRLRTQLVKLGVSKYNQVRAEFPSWLTTLKSNQALSPILLVDQTFADASIEFSGGSENSFLQMLNWGLDKLNQDANYCLIIKVHPDVILGTKKGYLHQLVKPHLTGDLKNRIHFLSEDVSPSMLIDMSVEVATVSSQLGFEALWQNKKVHCFSWPFYAGRGLTTDYNERPLTYPRVQVALPQLMHVALIEYPTYLHPDTQRECEIEDVLDYMQAHFSCRELSLPKLNVNNVSLWKRSFIPEFLAGNVKKISFNQAESESVKQLYWGMKQPEKSGWRMEDGFIRSVGLGADLRRPSSLVLDDQGIYYNGKKSSRLEKLLNEYTLNDYDQRRAEQLLRLINESAITKYNVDVVSPYLNTLKQNISDHRDSKDSMQQPVLLVAGQFQLDLSMQFGALDIKDNLSLLAAVRKDFPDAFIIYKEHPDVYSGVRPGKLSESDVMAFADEYVTDVAITELFELVDRVCTICSLAGFEALLRGLKVSTYGLPFYGGWGLTDDKYSFARRMTPRALNELLYITLVTYSRYVNWHTRKITTVESCICQLLKERETRIRLKSSWLSRQLRKLQYLSQALLDKHLFSSGVFQYFKGRSQ
jgi:capsular polysaccharide export protein